MRSALSSRHPRMGGKYSPTFRKSCYCKTYGNGIIPPMWSIYLNVAVQGVLTGLVYGLMALGLSVIFGVVRGVNFAHGEFAVVAMYAAYVLFTVFRLDPLWALLPLAAVFFFIGYGLLAVAVHPFLGRPEQAPFIPLVRVGIIIVNVLLIFFGPDARPENLSYGLDPKNTRLN